MLAASEPGAASTRIRPSRWASRSARRRARGRDKLTLVLPPALEPFGLWVEQLIAESTGKNGTGVVPIAGETLGGAGALRPRSVLRAAAAARIVRRGDARHRRARSRGRAAAPVAEIELPEPSALGAEFVRWEIATAIAGALLGINPFDEPNVQQAKDATRTLLDTYKSQGRLPVPPPDRTIGGGVTLTLSSAARQALGVHAPEALLTLLREGDYFALLAYVGPDPELADEFRALRHAVRDRTHAATMFGYGPRYLHSTGQLHKGGPNTGVFVLISATPRDDVPIPGEPFSFGTLELAQALGDFASLDATGRRALHVHLPAPGSRARATRSRRAPRCDCQERERPGGPTGRHDATRVCRTRQDGPQHGDAPDARRPPGRRVRSQRRRGRPRGRRRRDGRSRRSRRSSRPSRRRARSG